MRKNLPLTSRLVWLAVVILGRDISLAISAIYYRYASLPAPKTLARYWNFSLPSAEVHPTFVSKVNTALQLFLIGAAVTGPVFWTSSLASSLNLSYNGTVDNLWFASQALVGATTAWSGLSYLWTKNAVTFQNLDSKRAMEIVIRGRVILGLSFLGCLVVALFLERQKTEAEAKKESERMQAEAQTAFEEKKAKLDREFKIKQAEAKMDLEREQIRIKTELASKMADSSTSPSRDKFGNRWDHDYVKEYSAPPSSAQGARARGYTNTAHDPDATFNGS